jgi:hypothetical protein
MKSMRPSSFIQLVYRLSLCGTLLVCAWATPLMAQTSGSEAQGSTEPMVPAPSDLPLQPVKPATEVHKNVKPAMAVLSLPIKATRLQKQPTLPHWEQLLARVQRPAQPDRPIPLVLSLTGLLMMLVWGGLLVGAILTAGTTLGLVLLISTIVLSVLFIIGLVLFVGGLIAGLSGGKKRRPVAPQT